VAELQEKFGAACSAPKSAFTAGLQVLAGNLQTLPFRVSDILPNPVKTVAGAALTRQNLPTL